MEGHLLHNFLCTVRMIFLCKILHFVVCLLLFVSVGNGGLGVGEGSYQIFPLITARV